MVTGRASHAGVAPERGISSTMILALALADVKAGGWFGKVVKGKRQGTSNVGPVTGGDGRPAGDATNVVTDYVHVRGECRSHDSKFFKEITKAYKAAFEKAAKRVTNSDGKSGRVKFKAETDYHPFRMKENLPVVKRAVAAVSGIGTAMENASVDFGMKRLHPSVEHLGKACQFGNVFYRDARVAQQFRGPAGRNQLYSHSGEFAGKFGQSSFIGDTQNRAFDFRHGRRFYSRLTTNDQGPTTSSWLWPSTSHHHQ